PRCNLGFPRGEAQLVPIGPPASLELLHHDEGLIERLYLCQVQLFLVNVVGVGRQALVVADFGDHPSFELPPPPHHPEKASEHHGNGGEKTDEPNPIDHPAFASQSGSSQYKRSHMCNVTAFLAALPGEASSQSASRQYRSSCATTASG